MARGLIFDGVSCRSVTTFKRCASIATRYGYTDYLDVPGFYGFANPETGATVHFFTWGNPKHTDGGKIPDGYFIVIPNAGTRIAVRNRAWPVRGLPARSWAEVEADVDRLLGPVLSEPDPRRQAKLIKALPFEDTGGIGVALLRED